MGMVFSDTDLGWMETCRMQQARIAELEAALREAELLLTGLAMSPARVAVCPDNKLEAALVRAREALQKSIQ